MWLLVLLWLLLLLIVPAGPLLMRVRGLLPRRRRLGRHVRLRAVLLLLRRRLLLLLLLLL